MEFELARVLVRRHLGEVRGAVRGVSCFKREWIYSDSDGGVRSVVRETFEERGKLGIALPFPRRRAGQLPACAIDVPRGRGPFTWVRRTQHGDCCWKRT